MIHICEHCVQSFLDATHHIASPKVTDNEQKTENGKEYVSFKVEP